VLDTGATVGTAYGLKHLIHEERPDGSDDQSFPSDTAALAFAPAAFLWDRYGWEVWRAGLRRGRVRRIQPRRCKKHHWYDVAASAGMAWGYSQIFTSRYNTAASRSIPISTRRRMALHPREHEFLARRRSCGPGIPQSGGDSAT